VIAPAVEAPRGERTAPSACAWCGAALDEGAERLPGRIRCARCGVASTDPWPTREELDAAYAGAYRPESGRFAGPGDRLLHALRTAPAKRLDAIAPPGPVLDVGAGDGALVDALAARGREAVGIERPGAHERRTPHGARLYGSELEALDGEFAAIVFWHSAEHLRAPAEALRRAARMLVPGGVLVVALPNADSLQARAFGDRWLALDLPRHLVHVPARALLDLLREEGLRIERTSHLRGGQIVFGWLHGLVGRIPGTADLYDAIRRPAARSRPVARSRRMRALGAAAALLPVAGAAAGLEAALRRGGSVYVEARR
jgi:SAM-dependent methyltransferase